VLHGWTHSLGPNLLDWIFYKHDNRSEFRSLTRAEADVRLDQGSAMFHACFADAPNWFCAPRWQQSRAANDSLAARNYAGHFSIKAIHLADQSTIPLKALNFDEGERGWKIALARPLRSFMIRQLLRSLEPFRLVLHPHDALHAPTRQQFQALTATLDADGWVPLALDDVIAKWRAAA
jgi:predicted deacetylase